MDSVMTVARIFGPLLGIIGLWMLLYSDNVVKIATSIKGSPAAQYASAFFNLLFGLYIINAYNVWEWNMYFFVTLLGWVLFLRGVLGLYMPQLIVQWFMTKHSMTKTMGVVPFVWGLILTWIGFYM